MQAVRYHDICAGHRVVGHEGKCRYLHGHNYRIHFFCEGDGLDQIGRVIDFSVMKSTLCEWLEKNWDHKMLLWDQDPLLKTEIASQEGIVILPFNPTAENLAQYLLDVIGPECLRHRGVILTKVIIEETRKCSVTAEREPAKW
jgi:6-pyruvoyltetrahydropterin/6-carboxytetrahydropterin synthase